MTTLDDLRQDIDRVDEVLVRLLNERARCACEIGRLKKEQGIEVYQPDREKQVLEHVRERRRRRAARAGRDRPAVRAHHRRGAAARAARRARRSGGRRRHGIMNVRVLEATEAMVVVMEERASEAQIEQVVARLVEMGMDVHRSTGVTRTVLGAVGQKRPDPGLIEMLDGVHEVVRISEPYKLASRTFKPEGTVVTVGDVRIGGDEVDRHGRSVLGGDRAAGARDGRGGAARPARRSSAAARSSRAARRTASRASARKACGCCATPARAENLALVSEVMDVSQIALIGRYGDIFQVGARNMQNFTLLRELGHARKPVLLKRGISATIEEWLLSAEYILSGGNTDVILCERGIRTFETATRNTFDISAIPVVKKLSHLPIVADPSHGAGRRDMVAPMARAAVAAGADGLIIEVHCDPDHALSDGAQSMFPAQFDRLMAELRIIAPAIGRSICLEPVARRGWGS